LLNPLIQELFWHPSKKNKLDLFLVAFSQLSHTFSYSPSVYVFIKGVPITPLSPASSSHFYNCSSSPNLPEGLHLDSSSCVITGTPSSLIEDTTYSISAIGSLGSVSTNINITVRGLNTYKFSSSTDRTGNTNINCSIQDESSGIGPYSFNVPYEEDVLVTLTSNLRGPPAAWPTGGGDLNTIQIRLYIDGVLQQRLVDGRYYHQDTAMGSAFITTMTKGNHVIELRFCGNNTYYPFILGIYPTIITITSLVSSPYFDQNFSYKLPIGITNFASSASFTNIMNGTEAMSLTYNASNSILLWQSFALAGGAGIYGLTENYRLFPETTEDVNHGVDSYSPINFVTYHELGASTTRTVNAQYSGVSTSNVVTYANYDNTLNLIGFKTPAAGNFGKAVINSLVQTTSATFAPLTTIYITNSYDAKYLISFSANNAQGNSAGDSGCIFGLSINGGSVIAQTLVDNDAGGSLRNATIITIETIPSGTIPVVIQFKEFAPTSGCNVNNAVFTIIPLE